MIIYLSILVLVLVLSKILDGHDAVLMNVGRGRLRNFDIVYFAIYILLVFLMGFSREVGGDKQSYIEDYMLSPNWHDGWNYISDFLLLKAATGYMPLWSLLNITIKTIAPDDFTLFQFVHAAIVNGGVMLFFSRYSRYKYLCLAAFLCFRFFNFNCETMRESIAISIFLTAFPLLLKRRWLAYYAVCVIALGFHISSVMMLVFPLIPRIRFTFQRFVVMSALCVTVYFSVNVVLVRLIDILGGMLFVSRYVAYIEGAGNFFGFVGNYLAFMFVPGIAVWHMYSERDDMPEHLRMVVEKYFFLVPVLSALITFNRFFEYFAVFTIAIYAYYLWNWTLRRGWTFPMAIMVSAVIFVGVMSAYMIDTGGQPRYKLFAPYTSIFDDTNVQYRKAMYQEAVSSKMSVTREE